MVRPEYIFAVPPNARIPSSGAVGRGLCRGRPRPDLVPPGVRREYVVLAHERAPYGLVSVCDGVEVEELAGLDERVEQRGDARAEIGVRAVVVLPPEDRAADRAFGPSIVDRGAGGVEEAD